MSEKNKREVVSFRLDSQAFRDLQSAAKHEGLPPSGYARNATLDRMMGSKSLTATLEEDLKIHRKKQDKELEKIQIQLSLQTECILKMLADSGIGGMNRDQIESWVSRKMPRPGRREH